MLIVVAAFLAVISSFHVFNDGDGSTPLGGGVRADERSSRRDNGSEYSLKQPTRPFSEVTGASSIAMPAQSPLSLTDIDDYQRVQEDGKAVIADVSALDPAGNIVPDRIPPVAAYIHLVADEIRKHHADFARSYPETDVTDTDEFYESLMDKRLGYGLDMPEESWPGYASWVSEMEFMRQQLVMARGEHSGLAISGVDGKGRSYALIGFEGLLPVYSFTQNREAAISSAASFVRMNEDFDSVYGPDIHGGDLWVNVNDHGRIYDEHPEFTSDGTLRIVVIEEPWYDEANRAHMTHVAGTIGAHGHVTSAMGMAPRVWIRALIQQNTSHVLNYGMQTNGQPERSVVGNTSLGSESSTPGMYTSADRAFDQALWDRPYYLHFYAAGNSGPEFNTLTISGKVCKNLITVGSVSDVTRTSSGDYSGGGNISSFSSRGPARDGRIKPDITANGEALYSPNSESGYASYSGTSMSSPNAAGSALLLIDYYRKRFPGQYPRSATVKALIINTTDDRGNPGPDYTYGWGIINTHRAATIIKNHADNPLSKAIVEDRLDDGQTTILPYYYDGDGPIRVTLCWTDLPGPTQESYDDQTPRLVNNLHLRLISPGNEFNYPYVMPYVTGTDAVSAFDSTLYDAPAVTGVNNTDNVIQVYVEDPEPGAYTIEIYHDGHIEGGGQDYSLVVWGLTLHDPDTDPPDIPSYITYPTHSATGLFTVNWSAVDGATGYILERSINGDDDWAVIYTGPDVEHDEAVDDGSYLYRVRSVNSAGESEWRTGEHDCVVQIADSRASQIVDAYWGNQFVGSNADLRGEQTGAIGDFNGDGTQDYRRVRAFDETTLLNPDASVNGKSTTFYGGAQATYFGSTTVRPFQRFMIRNVGGDPLQISTNESHSGNRSLHGLVIWLAKDFLDMSTEEWVTFSQPQDVLKLSLATEGNSITPSFRFVVKTGGQYYISAYAINSTSSTSQTQYILNNPAVAQWTQFNPFAEMHFDQHSASFTSLNFGPLEAVGYYFGMDDASTHLNFRSTGFSVDATIISGIPPPQAPGSITYQTNSSTGRYTVSWAESENGESYRLDRSNDGGLSWEQIFNGDQTLYSEMIDNGNYRYRVRAVNSSGESDWLTGDHDCVVALSPQEIWRREQFGEDAGDEETSGPLADPNEDGIVNLLKFALRGDPYTDDGSKILPRMQEGAGNGETLFVFRVRSAEGEFEESGGYAVDDLTYFIMIGNDLAEADWVQLILTTENTTLAEDEDGDVLRIHVDPEGVILKGFLRLKVRLDE